MTAAADTLRVDPSNQEQALSWDGDEGAYWASHVLHYDESVAAYDASFLAASAIQPGERVLDIGCGNGQTTRAAARAASSGSALGVDLSARMIEVARGLAEEEGVANASFEQADAQIYAFVPGSFDRAISRTGAMFFGGPDAAFRNIAAALRTGGRLTLLHWQAPAENEWFIDFTTAFAAGRQLPAPPPDAPSPFSMADPERTRAILSDAGFTEIRQDALSAPMKFGRDVDDAQGFIAGFLGWMLEGLDGAGRTGALAALRATLERHQGATGIAYSSSAWLVTARKK